MSHSSSSPAGTARAGASPTGTGAGGEWQKTACILCECNCGLEVKLEGRTLAKIRGDKAHPTSAGYTCEKALRLDRYQNQRERLTSPLRRRADGEYEEIDWDTAIAEIAAKLTAVRATHGGERIFFYAGGGQGNHLGAAYGQSLRSALGTTLYSNALAQEKTGEAWVDAQLYGPHTKGDFEHSEVVLFLGKNPWQSHSFPRARPTLKAIAADPDRAMIVIDPRRSETADLADFHLQVKPGTDAWCLAAMLGVLVQEDLLDHGFITGRTHGVESVLPVLAAVPIADYAERCGVDDELLRAAARRFAAARSATTYEDLGIQQGPNSVLVSYLNKLMWILTGNFGRPGTMYLHTWMVSLAGVGDSRETSAEAAAAVRSPRRSITTRSRRAAKRAVATAGSTVFRALTAAAGAGWGETALERAAGAVRDRIDPGLGGGVGANSYPRTARRSPVSGARIIAGLLPANSIADEILTEDPQRLRAMWIDSSNPVNSLPESDRFTRAMRALDLTVVVDVAFTETARQADYVLPAATQYEKWEATFFNFEFPRNVFQLRRPLIAPLEGTLPEAEIYTRMIRAVGGIDPGVIARLRAAAQVGRATFALAFFSAALGDPTVLKQAAYVTYETLGTTLPEGERATAVLWAAAHLCATTYSASVARAGFDGPGLRPGEDLFNAIVTSPSGVTFTVDEWDDVWNLVRRADHRITADIPSLLEDLADLDSRPSTYTSAEFPFVLAAGERRSFTANTIIRDPSWRRRDHDGALRISPLDAQRLGVVDGDTVQVTTEGGTARTAVELSDTMQTGHISLPNGMGLDHPVADGARVTTGVATNRLTLARYRDPFAGTPWHKHVPARVERLPS